MTEETKETPANISSTESAVEDFHRQGYVVLPQVMDDELIERLKVVIDRQAGGKPDAKTKKKKHSMFKRVFETHPELCLQVFQNETVLALVQRILTCCGSPRGGNDNSLAVHVIHNNAFRMDPGLRGQAAHWHTDDPPVFQTHDGKPLPPQVQVAPLVLTCMFFLNDLKTPEDGGTRVIEGSHRFGCHCTPEEAARLAVSYTACPAGSVLIISAHTWHRGAPVAPTAEPRYVFQATYGRRLVGHKHGSIMSYTLPSKVEKALKTDEDRKLMGFLQGGAYS